MNKTAWPDHDPGLAGLTVGAVGAVLVACILPVGAVLLALVVMAAGLIIPPVAGVRAIVRWRQASARAAVVHHVPSKTVVLEPAVRVQIGAVRGMCPLQHVWEPGQTFFLNGEVTGLETPCEKAVHMVRAQRAEMVTSGEMTRTAACVGQKHRIEFQIERVEA